MKSRRNTLYTKNKLRNICIAFAVCLLSLCVCHSAFVEQLIDKYVHIALYEVNVCFHTIIDRCVRGYEKLCNSFSDEVLDELDRLREENINLKHQVASLAHLAQENTAFRKMLNIQEKRNGSIVVVKIISVFDSDFSRNCLINAGSNSGVSVNDTVLNDDVLVGRVVEVGNNWSRVLLITDETSYLPVVVGDNHIPAIIKGNNNDDLNLVIVHNDASLVAGSEVYTAGYDNELEGNIKIGRVYSADGRFFVKPSSGINGVSYLNVLKRCKTPVE